MKTKTYPIFLVFLCMGFGDVVGPLVGLSKDTFQLSYTMAQLIPFSGFLTFALLSVPVGILQDKKGKKYILMLGLSVALSGLILPMLNGMYGIMPEFNPEERLQFYVLLTSILLLCAGATILQVVGNPVMKDVSPKGAYSKNLSLAQSIKAVGSSLGFLLPPLVVYLWDLDWSFLFPVFSVLILITLFQVKPLKILEDKDAGSGAATVKSCISLLKNGYVLMMVTAIFLYVGAEVSMSSGIPILLKENFSIEGFSLWVSWGLFFLPILLGRYAGAMILGKVSAKKFLIATVFLALVGVIAMFASNQVLTYAGVILVGLGFANIFPLVFSITIEEMPARANELSGLMVSAISGGAVVPLIMGSISDISDVLTGFLVPLVCILYLIIISFISLMKVTKLTPGTV